MILRNSRGWTVHSPRQQDYPHISRANLDRIGPRLGRAVELLLWSDIDQCDRFAITPTSCLMDRSVAARGAVISTADVI